MTIVGRKGGSCGLDGKKATEIMANGEEAKEWNGRESFGGRDES